MPAMFSPCDQTSDIEQADLVFLNICRGMLPAHSENVIRTVEGFRANDRSFDGAALRLCFANARNIGEAYLNAIAAAEAECKGHLAARGQSLFSSLPPLPRQLPGIPTGYAEAISPAGVA